MTPGRIMGALTLACVVMVDIAVLSTVRNTSASLTFAVLISGYNVLGLYTARWWFEKGRPRSH